MERPACQQPRARSRRLSAAGAPLQRPANQHPKVRDKLLGMTPLTAVACSLLAVAVYAWIGFWRYEPIDTATLADYQPLSEAATSNGGNAVIAGVVVLGAVIFALGHFGRPDLQGPVWAGTAITVLAALTVKSFLPSRCQKCTGPVRCFRKRQNALVPAIIHLRVCDHCRTYREDQVIGLAEG
jgi:hypothetical protein